MLQLIAPYIALSPLSLFIGLQTHCFQLVVAVKHWSGHPCGWGEAFHRNLDQDYFGFSWSNNHFVRALLNLNVRVVSTWLDHLEPIECSVLYILFVSGLFLSVLHEHKIIAFRGFTALVSCNLRGSFLLKVLDNHVFWLCFNSCFEYLFKTLSFVKFLRHRLRGFTNFQLSLTSSIAVQRKVPVLFLLSPTVPIDFHKDIVLSFIQLFQLHIRISLLEPFSSFDELNFWAQESIGLPVYWLPHCMHRLFHHNHSNVGVLVFCISWEYFLINLGKSESLMAFLHDVNLE